MANCSRRPRRSPSARPPTRCRPRARRTALVPHRVFEGNRPTNTILAERLTPHDARHAGRALRAQRLHAGRDLGHRLVRPVGRRAGQGAGAAHRRRARERRPSPTLAHDSSTNALIRRYRRLRDRRSTPERTPWPPDQPARRQAGARRRSLVDVAQARRRVLRPSVPIRPCRRSASPSAPRAIAARRSSVSFNESHVLAITPGDLPLPRAAGHRRPAVPRHRHARAVGAGVRRARSRCWPPTASTCMIAADDEYTPTPAVSHAILVYNRGRTSGLADGIVDHAVAQSARRRRLQVQPAERRPGRHRHHAAGSRPRPTSCSKAGLDGRAAHRRTRRRCARRRRTGTTTSTPTSPTSAASSTSTRSAAPASAWASIRSAAPACTTGRAIAERYGSTSPSSATRSIRPSAS